MPFESGFPALEVDVPDMSIQAEYARERNRAAAERTLMAWIRTCLSLISFGFGIAGIVAALPGFGLRVNTFRLSRILGLLFIALGIYAMIVAAIEHQRELRLIETSEDYSYRSRRSLALTVAGGIVIIGVVAFGGIVLRQFIS